MVHVEVTLDYGTSADVEFCSFRQLPASTCWVPCSVCTAAVKTETPSFLTAPHQYYCSESRVLTIILWNFNTIVMWKKSVTRKCISSIQCCYNILWKLHIFVKSYILHISGIKISILLVFISGALWVIFSSFFLFSEFFTSIYHFPNWENNTIVKVNKTQSKSVWQKPLKSLEDTDIWGIGRHNLTLSI